MISSGSESVRSLGGHERDHRTREKGTGGVCVNRPATLPYIKTTTSSHPIRVYPGGKLQPPPPKIPKSAPKPLHLEQTLDRGARGPSDPDSAPPRLPRRRQPSPPPPRPPQAPSPPSSARRGTDLGGVHSAAPTPPVDAAA